MEVFAKGKNIPTYAFGNLFIQGEKLADTVTVSVERYYSNTDISEYKFMIVGVTEDGWEVNQILEPEATDDKYIRLKWNVSSDFTVNAGKLCLELRAFETVNDEIHIMIKYDMPSVFVKPTISGKNEPLPDTGEQLINNINVAAAERLGEIWEQSNAVSERLQESVNNFNVHIQESLNNFNVWVQEKINSFNLEATNSRLDKMEEDTAVYLARPEVIPVSRSQYNSMAHKKDALYVIIGEE